MEETEHIKAVLKMNNRPYQVHFTSSNVKQCIEENERYELEAGEKPNREKKKNTNYLRYYGLLSASVSYTVVAAAAAASLSLYLSPRLIIHLKFVMLSPCCCFFRACLLLRQTNTHAK